MATTLTVFSLSPSVAHFRMSAPEGTTVSFMKSGAVGQDKDLTSLSPGPLKEFLNRLSNWATVVEAGPNPKVRWRFLVEGNYQALPVSVGNAFVPMIIQSNTTSLSVVSFSAGVSLGWELAFIHSLQR